MSPRAKEDKYELAQFINAHFLPSGSELVPVDPPDFTETPSLLGAFTPAEQTLAQHQNRCADPTAPLPNPNKQTQPGSRPTPPTTSGRRRSTWTSSS